MAFIWPLLFFLSLLLSPVVGHLDSKPNATPVFYDNSASVTSPTATSTSFVASKTFINTFIAPTTVRITPTPEPSYEFDGYTDSFYTVRPSATTTAGTPTAFATTNPINCIRTLSPAASSAASLVRKTLHPHFQGRSPPRVNTPPTVVTPHQYRLYFPGSYMVEQRMNNPAPDLAFTDVSFSKIECEDPQVQANASSSHKAPSPRPKNLAGNLSDSDDKRRRLIISSQARHLGSFVFGPVKGYTLDCGVNHLPKNWSPQTDPPQINDLVDEWESAITAAQQEAADLEAERMLSKAARQCHESATTKIQRDKSFLDWAIGEALLRLGELEDKLEDIAYYQSMQESMIQQAQNKDKHASEKYLQGVTMIILARRARETTDPTSTSVTLFIPPLYPPLPPTPFAFFRPATWRPKVALRMAGDTIWSIYQALCLRIALLALFCVLSMYERDDESPPPHDRNVFPGFYLLFDDDEPANDNLPHKSHDSSTDSEPHRGRTQDRGTQTDVTDSGRLPTKGGPQNSRNSVQVPSDSEPVSTGERAPSPPGTKPVSPEEKNKTPLSFPTRDFDFTPPKPALADHRFNAPSPSHARVSDPASTPARVDRLDVDISQQTRLHPGVSSVASTSSAKKAKRVDTKHSVLPLSQAASRSAPVACKSATMNPDVVPAPAPKLFIEKHVETINQTPAAGIYHAAYSAAPSTSVATAIEHINFNPFPFYSIATRNETNAMPVHTEQVPAFPREPVTTSYTFFTQPVAQHQATNNMPAAPFFYLPQTTLFEKNNVPAPLPEVAGFPFRGAYPPWSAPEQPAAATRDFDVVPAACDPQALSNAAVVEPVVQPSFLGFEPTAAQQVAAQPETPREIKDVPATLHLPIASIAQEESTSPEAAVEAAAVSATSAPLPDNTAAPIEPTPMQDKATKHVDSPVRKPSQSETTMQSSVCKPKGSLQTARKLMNIKAKSAAKESSPKPKRKGVKANKATKNNKKKAVVGGVVDGVGARNEDEDSGDDAGEVDDLLAGVCDSDEDEDVEDDEE
ncbi:hypothetical protein QFC22_004607 [Naganishia vaughanmartiniae]|uniref:Uncharacterized protein n=1 Tax=Naganishia vaughanmartiniae TaxID=1424756 RepID=A0ACC2WYR9_9TREE|nr:hypothetical protein QFC22_004607 [Naganishia vaughanmartiniae]